MSGTWIESLHGSAVHGPYADEIEASAAMDAMGLSDRHWKIVVRPAAVSGDKVADAYQAMRKAADDWTEGVGYDDGGEEMHSAIADYTDAVATAPLPAVRRGTRIRIIPEAGPERVMVVMHVEHHIITMADDPLD